MLLLLLLALNSNLNLPILSLLLIRKINFLIAAAGGNSFRLVQLSPQKGSELPYALIVISSKVEFP